MQISSFFWLVQTVGIFGHHASAFQHPFGVQIRVGKQRCEDESLVPARASFNPRSRLFSIASKSSNPTSNISSDRRSVEKSYEISNNRRNERKTTRVPSISKPWLDRLEELKQYRDEHGHCNVPRKGPLGNWVQKQRLAYKTKSNKSNKLLQEQIDKLNDLGFIWDVHEYKYQLNLNQLRKFYEEYGHIDVPSSPVDGPYRALYKWTSRQKEEYKQYLYDFGKSSLTNERRKSLEEIGFHVGMFNSVQVEVTMEENGKSIASTTFNTSNTSPSPLPVPTPITIIQKRYSWRQRYEQLLKFREEYGHCNVSTTDVKYAKLSRWVQHQRAEKKKRDKGQPSRLSIERERLLEDIGFIWSYKEYRWQEKLDQLREYKNKHGHCNVPTKEGELGSWVMTQRSRYNKGLLSPEQVDALNEIDFIWDMYSLAWNNRYEQLRRITSPCTHETETLTMSASLSAWAATQRAEKRYKDMGLQNHLTNEREGLLNEIGFDWNVNERRKMDRSATWMKNFVRLEEHINATWSCKVPVKKHGGDCNDFAIWVRDQRRYVKAFDSGLDSPMTMKRREKLASIGFQ